METSLPTRTVGSSYLVEVAFCIIWMLIGVAFYSAVIGLVSAFFQNNDTKESLLKMRLANIDEFCTKLNIPESLQKKLEESLKYSADKLAYLWLSSEEDIYGDLNINLKFEFLKAIHEDLITNCHFFKGKDLGFVTRIVPCMRPIFFRAGETIWNKDDDAVCAYFLTSGKICFSLYGEIEQVLYSSMSRKKKTTIKRQTAIETNLQNSKMEFQVKVFHAVTYFGEVEILLRKNRIFNAKALTDCHMLMLSRSDFEVIIKDEYNYIYNEFRNTAMERYQQMLEDIREIKKLAEENGPYDLTISSEIKDALDQSLLKKTNKTPEELYFEAQGDFPIEELLKTVLAEEQHYKEEAEEELLGLEDLKQPEIEVLIHELQGIH